jgi:hypothetical protein
MTDFTRRDTTRFKVFVLLILDCGFSRSFANGFKGR